MKTTRTTTSNIQNKPATTGKYTVLTGKYAKVSLSWGKTLWGAKVVVASETSEEMVLGGQNVEFRSVLYHQTLTSLVVVMAGPQKGYWVRLP